MFCSLIALVFASLFSSKTVSKQDLGGGPPQSRRDQDRKDIYQGSVLRHFPSSVLRGPQAAVSSCVAATCLKAMPVSGLLSSSLMGLERASPRRRLKMRVTTVRAVAGMQSPPAEGPCAVSPPPPSHLLWAPGRGPLGTAPVGCWLPVGLASGRHQQELREGGERPGGLFPASLPWGSLRVSAPVCSPFPVSVLRFWKPLPPLIAR